MCGRSARGNRIEPTGKFSPAARSATRATSAISIPASFCLNPSCRGQPVRDLVVGTPPRASSRKGAPTTVAEEIRPTQGGASARETPVAAVTQNDGSIVVSLAGELDLYNAATVRETLVECCNQTPARLVVDLSAV